MAAALEVFSDLSERLNYNLPDFPLYARRGELMQFDRCAAACHWHSDLEFILVLDGCMDYFVNGQIVSLQQNRGIFVNAKRLHYGFSNNMEDCSFLVAAVHPSLIGVGDCKAYFEEKFGAASEDYIVLAEETPWQKQALTMVRRLYDEMHGIKNPLRLLAFAAELCALVGDHILPAAAHTNDEQWATVRKMTGYIHLHYGEKLTLEQIAAAGAVCRSSACALFKKHIGISPNTYLIRYRVQKACEMLRDTNRSAVEIGLACGFRSASYFSRSFKQETGLVPLAYKRQAGMGK
ncbi:MAG TPA: AraC family transcriptional regulator [Clostridia bacterium]|nr:AraC family transcriptional regulator [Clostridia bacterium]